MKIIVLCLMVASHSLAAPNKRDVEYYGYYELPAHSEYGPPARDYELPVETTTHYCPEEDIQGKFIPSPPEITSFPLPQLPVAVYGPPIVKQELLPYPAAPEIPQPIHAEYGIPLVKQEIPPPVIHAEYGVPHQEVLIVKEAAYPAKQEVLDEEIIVPHEEYGVPHAEYGVPETSSTTTTTTTTVKPHKEKIVTYIQPKLVILKKKFEFPILKKLLEKKFKKFL